MARVHLEDDVLAKGSDLAPTPLKVVDDASGAVVGELTVGVKALDALTKMGKPVHADTLSVEVQELKLTKAPPAKGGIRLLIDMLGVAELDTTTKKATAHGDGLYATPFQKTYSLAPPSKLADTILAALKDSSELEDSEIQVVVEALDRSGTPSTYGTCHLALKTLLEGGKDFAMDARPVKSANGKETLGTLRCGVTALAALKTLTEGSAGGAGGSASLKFSVHDVMLARPPKPSTPLVVHVDLLGAEALASSPITPKAGTAVPLDFAAAFTLEPDSSSREAIAKARPPQLPPPQMPPPASSTAASSGTPQLCLPLPALRSSAHHGAPQLCPSLPRPLL